MPKKTTNYEKIINDPYNYAKNIPVKELVKLLEELATSYYNQNDNMISDEIYDILRNTLAERDPSNIYLKKTGAPITKDKVKLPYHMASLDKIKPDTDILATWKNKYRGPYVLSDKLDGVSGLLVRVGTGFKLYTRGDGDFGQDISHLIPYVLPSSRVNLMGLPDGSSIRGELIISKKNFETVADQFKNARNIVSGLVNAKHYNETVANITDFIGYTVLSNKINGPKLNAIDQMKQLEKWKFPMVNYIIKTFDELTNDMLSKYLVERRQKSDYEVDGIVVFDGSKTYDYENKNPSYGFAFKTVLTDQVAEAIVIDIEWTCSKHGYLKPRVKIEPVKLVGVTINYTTAFNAKFVLDNVLGPGAVIKLVRSGDVIPHILEVIKPAASKKAKMPDIPYTWTSTGVDIIVKDIHGACKDQIIIKKLTSFFAVLGVMHFSEGIITKFVENGYNTVKKIIVADKNKLYEIDGLGKKSIDKIYDGINNAFNNITLTKLAAASSIFGRGLGERKLKIIFDTYPDIMTKNVSRDKLMELPGFSDVTVDQFLDNFTEFKKFYNEIVKVIGIDKFVKTVTKNKDQQIKTKNNIFENMKIVFTGFRNKEWEQFIEKNGGSVTTSVSKNTNLVISSDPSSSKAQKAQSLGISQMTPEQFEKKYIK